MLFRFKWISLMFRGFMGVYVLFCLGVLGLGVNGTARGLGDC